MPGQNQTSGALDTLGVPFEPFSTKVFADKNSFPTGIQNTELKQEADSLADIENAYWKSGIFSILESLSQPGRWTSRLVLAEIDRWGKQKKCYVFIVPRDFILYYDVYGKPDSPKKVQEMYMQADSRPRLGSSGPGMMRNASENLQGAGDTAIVEFDPSVWNPNNTFRQIMQQMFPSKYQSVGMDPDDVLLHELVHAMRVVKGLRDTMSPTGRHEYRNIEEFLAVLVTNIAISEKNPSTGLRYHHDGFARAPYNSAQGFLSTPGYMNLLQYLYMQDPGFFHNIACSPNINAFNPIRYYLLKK